MSISPSPAVSDDELREALNEGGVEFVDGELQEKSVSRASRRIGARVAQHLNNAVGTSKVGEVYIELPFRCFDDSDPRTFRKPDVSFMRAERIPPDQDDVDWSTVPADLAVEVISPTDRFLDVRRKLLKYLAAGFGTVWIVDSVGRSVEVYRAGQPSVTFSADQEITGEPFLPGFRCKVAAFFE